jgi:hypothetical protein
MFAKNFISKIFVPLGINVDTLTIYVKRHVYSIQWENANSQLRNAVFLTIKRWMSVFPVFLT